MAFGKSESEVVGYEQVRRKIAESVVEILVGGNIDQILWRLENAANKTLEEY